MSLSTLDIFKEVQKQNAPDTSLSQNLPVKNGFNTATATELVSRIEVAYNFTATLPTFEALLEDWEGNEAELRSILIEDVNKKLELRGLPQYRFETIKVPKIKTPSEYDPLFILACNRILSVTRSDSFQARIKELKPLGITQSTWDGWMKNPRYSEYALNLFNQHFDKDLNLQADIALSKKIQEGDMVAIKFYKELTGRFNVKTETESLSANNIAIATLLGFVMEILSKHVETNTLERIANELENTPVGALLEGKVVE